MGDVGASLLKGLVLFHRWVGVVMCLMFATWFATGAMMVFVAFPALPAGEAAAHSEPVDLARVAVDPAALAGRLGSPSEFRLVSRLGEPAYLGKVAGKWKAVSAVGGGDLPPISPTEASQIASAFGGAPVERVSQPFAYDQWVVHQQFDPWRPLYRVRLADRAGTELYVSEATGEVVQRTRRMERAANWVGSVIHWLYLTPLRRSFSAWDWTVWTLGLVGVAVVTAGVWLGVRTTNRKMRSRKPGVTPFRGLMKWHHVLGLCAATFVLCWITSGWLSMDHGRLFSDGALPADAARAYQGGGTGGPPAPSLGDLHILQGARVSRLQFGAVDGCAVVGAYGARGPRSIADCGGEIRTGAGAPRDLVLSAVAKAFPQARLVSAGPVHADAPYAKAEGLPEGALQVKLQGEKPLRLMIDPVSGAPIVLMDRSREAYAWVYYMLHTYNFPGLSTRPVLRITLLLIPLTLGFAFSVTGVLVGFRRLTAFAPAKKPAKR